MGVKPCFSSKTTFICIILNEDDKISHTKYTFSERLFNGEYLNISFVEETTIYLCKWANLHNSHEKNKRMHFLISYDSLSVSPTTLK